MITSDILTVIGVIFLILVAIMSFLVMVDVLQPKLKGDREREQRKVTNEQGAETYYSPGKIQIVTSNT